LNIYNVNNDKLHCHKVFKTSDLNWLLQAKNGQVADNSASTLWQALNGLKCKKAPRL
jgi:hypothetical protein